MHIDTIYITKLKKVEFLDMINILLIKKEIIIMLPIYIKTFSENTLDLISIQKKDLCIKLI